MRKYWLLPLDLKKKNLYSLINCEIIYYFQERKNLGSSEQNKQTIELEGRIIESLPNAQFRVELDSGQIVLGLLAGKMKMYHIRVLPGDKVLLEMTPYDLTKGRIIRRLK